GLLGSRGLGRGRRLVRGRGLLGRSAGRPCRNGLARGAGCHRARGGRVAIYLSVLLGRVCAFRGLPHSTCPLGHGVPPHAKRARGGAPRTPEAGKNTEPGGFRQTCHTSRSQFGLPLKSVREFGQPRPNGVSL